MPSKKVVVTGGAGFIGSILAAELAKIHEVAVIDNLSTGRMENISEIHNIKFIKGSILDLSLLKQAFEDPRAYFIRLPSLRCSGQSTILSPPTLQT